MSLESIAAARCWKLSCELQRRGVKPLARLMKGINFLLFRALLPTEAKIGEALQLKHYGLGVVIHPNVVIGDRVTICHGVTIAGESWIGSPHLVQIGDDVVIGVGAAVIPRPNTGLRIGDRAVIGAGAVVTRDVPDDTIAVGVPARLRPREVFEGTS